MNRKPKRFPSLVGCAIESGARHQKGEEALQMVPGGVRTVGSPVSRAVGNNNPRPDLHPYMERRSNKTWISGTHYLHEICCLSNLFFFFSLEVQAETE